jgi:type 1 glutamine amidotransferase
VVFVAGEGGHGEGQHAHREGCQLLAECLEHSGLPFVPAIYARGWPADPTAFDNADALVFYVNGGDGHVINPHLDEVDRLMKKGVGLACLHYAVEVPKGKVGDRFLDWIGGYFEQFWSVNPTWTADFQKLPSHPVTRGVRPFKINDEWYYHMRLSDRATPILEAVPPESTREQPDGPHSGNAAVRARKGMAETMAWAIERPGGGRGFGFTGGHYHKNWSNDDFRKLVLNAIAWVAGVEVPAKGVDSRVPAEAKTSN